MSSYYYKKTKTKKEGDGEVLNMIHEVLAVLPRSGYRTVTRILNRAIKINHKKVERIMRQNGLKCIIKVRKGKTTNSGHKLQKYPNQVKQKQVTGINQVIVGDVTYFDIKGKNHYTASLMDLYSRRIVGIAISDRNDVELVQSALMDAPNTRGDLTGCIHHTDSDVRYCSEAYVKNLKDLGMDISMCVGNVYENAHAESLNKTLKWNEINLNEYDSKEEAARCIIEFSKVYNEYKPHSALNGMTPIEYENKLLNEKKRNKNKKL